MLKSNTGGYGMPKFRGENFRRRLSNREICESFLPQKFSAIWYLDVHNEHVHIQLLGDNKINVAVIYTGHE